jgi:hypothetical protein
MLKSKTHGMNAEVMPGQWGFTDIEDMNREKLIRVTDESIVKDWDAACQQRLEWRWNAYGFFYKFDAQF